MDVSEPVKTGWTTRTVMSAFVVIALASFCSPTLKTLHSSTTPVQHHQEQFDHKGKIALTHLCGEGGGYSHVMLPNTKACLFHNDGTQAGRTLVGASSYHPGGVNVGFLDGSVKFLKDSVSGQTWGAIATTSGGEVIDASSL